jgi:ABC-2 type transport system permease protein
MRAPISIVIRSLALVGKELVETVRRPGAMVGLALGPFLIMAVFGLGYDGVRRPLDTIVVVDPSSEVEVDLETYQRLAGGGLHVVEVTPDRTAAESRLVAGDVDLVIVSPDDAQARLRAGEQSVIEVLVNDVDPVAAGNAGILAAGLSNAVNREAIERVATEGQQQALAVGGEVAPIPPHVIAAPTRAELINVAPSEPGVLAFFGPAVLALILQHMAASLVALSLVRERRSAVFELFRIAPVSPAEILFGKMLAVGLIAGAIGALTLGLLVGVFRVPMLADGGEVAIVIALLVIASIGLGLLIGAISDSERQAVQLALLLLLATVFFSGFVLAIEEFTTPVRVLASVLPATHGIHLLQDLLLRGESTRPWEVALLGLIGLTTTVCAWLALRRGMSRA